jgi:hypothetical protein
VEPETTEVRTYSGRDHGDGLQRVAADGALRREGLVVGKQVWVPRTVQGRLTGPIILVIVSSVISASSAGKQARC